MRPSFLYSVERCTRPSLRPREDGGGGSAFEGLRGSTQRKRIARGGTREIAQIAIPDKIQSRIYGSEFEGSRTQLSANELREEEPDCNHKELSIERRSDLWQNPNVNVER
jgi:hypothetical protein